MGFSYANYESNQPYTIMYIFQNRELKHLSNQIAGRFGVKSLAERGLDPHITLMKINSTINIKKIGRILQRTALQHHSPGFTIKNPGWFRNVVCLKISPSPDFSSIRHDLVNGVYLSGYYTWEPHITLAMHDVLRKEARIVQFLKTVDIPNTFYSIDKLVLLKNNQMVCGYDFDTSRLFYKFAEY